MFWCPCFLRTLSTLLAQLAYLVIRYLVGKLKINLFTAKKISLSMVSLHKSQVSGFKNSASICTGGGYRILISLLRVGFINYDLLRVSSQPKAFLKTSLIYYFPYVLFLKTTLNETHICTDISDQWQINAEYPQGTARNRAWLFTTSMPIAKEMHNVYMVYYLHVYGIHLLCSVPLSPKAWSGIKKKMHPISI